MADVVVESPRKRYRRQSRARRDRILQEVTAIVASAMPKAPVYERICWTLQCHGNTVQGLPRETTRVFDVAGADDGKTVEFNGEMYRVHGVVVVNPLKNVLQRAWTIMNLIEFSAKSLAESFIVSTLTRSHRSIAVVPGVRYHVAPMHGAVVVCMLAAVLADPADALDPLPN